MARITTLTSAVATVKINGKVDVGAAKRSPK
jgi:hypothetical protein